MKLALLIFAISLCCCYSASAVGGYTQISSSEIQKSVTIKSLAAFGADYAIQQAILAGKLSKSGSKFTVTKINSVYQQVVNGINYKYDITLMNLDKSTTVNTVFIIYYQPATNSKVVTSYSLYVLPHSVTPVQAGGYIPVSPLNIQKSAVIISLAGFGGEYVIQQAIAAGKLAKSSSKFTVSKINSVYQQVVNGMNYKYDVTLKNSDKSITVNTAFVVYYQPATNTKTVTTYSLYVLPHIVDPASAGGYTVIASADIKKNAIIQSLANFGGQYIIQQAIARKDLAVANSKFSVSQINSVHQQVVNGINYKYDIVLTNSSKKTVISAVFFIYYQPSTKTKEVTSFSYNILNK